MLVIRGVNVYPHAIEDAVRGVIGLGSEYRIVVERPRELDVLAVEIEAENDASARAVREQVKAAVGIAPDVRIRPRGTLPRSDLKSRRVEDRRESAGPP
jgi:phenylacetate-CoA ligase